MKAALSALLLGSTLLHAAEYRFTLNGAEVDPHILPVMGERKGAFSKGDIGHVEEFPFVLGEPGHYQFRFDNKHPSKLFCKRDTDAECCVAIVLPSLDFADFDPFSESASVSLVPLQKMSPEEKAHLRGIKLDGSLPAEVPDGLFEGVAWNNTVLSTNLHKSRQLPTVLRGLRYLEIPFLSDQEMALLKNLHQLRYLKLTSVGCFDFSQLENSVHLRNVDIGHGIGPAVNSTALGKLRAMRFLKLRNLEGLENVSFVRTMPHLRVFKVDRTSVSDLRPVEACPELRLLSASGTRISHLPDATKLPNLRDVRLLSTPVAHTTKLMAAFRAAAPQAVVSANWVDALRSKLDSADRLLITSGLPLLKGTVPTSNIKDRRDIARLFDLLRIDEPSSGDSCLCGGQILLEFFRGEKLLAKITLHHGKNLRWYEGLWPGDAFLTLDSATQMGKFLKKHGIPAPKIDRVNQDEQKQDGEIPGR